MKRALALAALALLTAGRLEAASPVLEKPKGFATDKAGVFPPARLRALNEELAAFERATSNQIVVYVDRRLPTGTTLEELANVTFRSWAIGQKDKSNGVLFLVFTEDRLMRIEVGYGLEGVITDARSRRITGEVVKPFFKKGDYAGGVEAGARALMTAAHGERNVGTGRTVAERKAPLPLWAGFTVVVTTSLAFIVGLFRQRENDQDLPTTLAVASGVGSIASFVCAVISGPPSFWWLGGGLALFAVLCLVSRVGSGSSSGASSSDSSSYDSSSSSSWSSDSSSSSSSDSSSDFSGGGGDSGGGGSSDSW